MHNIWLDRASYLQVLDILFGTYMYIFSFNETKD